MRETKGVLLQNAHPDGFARVTKGAAQPDNFDLMLNPIALAAIGTLQKMLLLQYQRHQQLRLQHRWTQQHAPSRLICTVYCVFMVQGRHAGLLAGKMLPSAWFLSYNQLHMSMR